VKDRDTIECRRKDKMGKKVVKSRWKVLEAIKHLAESGGYLNQAHKNPKDFT
jgi:hypothetical protein